MPQLLAYLTAALLGLAASVACSDASPMLTSTRLAAPTTVPTAERFRLSAAPAAAVGYPMQVIDGRFLPPAA